MRFVKLNFKVVLSNAPLSTLVFAAAELGVGHVVVVLVQAAHGARARVARLAAAGRGLRRVVSLGVHVADHRGVRGGRHFIHIQIKACDFWSFVVISGEDTLPVSSVLGPESYAHFTE